MKPLTLSLPISVYSPPMWPNYLSQPIKTTHSVSTNPSLSSPFVTQLPSQPMKPLTLSLPVQVYLSLCDRTTFRSPWNHSRSLYQYQFILPFCGPTTFRSPWNHSRCLYQSQFILSLCDPTTFRSPWNHSRCLYQSQFILPLSDPNNFRSHLPPRSSNFFVTKKSGTHKKQEAN